MILTGEAAIEGLCHTATESFGRLKVIIYHDGKRYGGFKDANHAAFVIKQMGWKTATIEVGEATDGIQSNMELP